MTTELGHVPVIELGEPESGTGLDLNFVVVTQARFLCTVIAVRAVDNVPIGAYLKWRADTGEMKMILVPELYRHRAIGAGMWRAAHDAAARTDWMHEPCHSPERTLEGDRWAKSVGGDLPSAVTQPLPYEEMKAAGMFADGAVWD